MRRGGYRKRERAEEKRRGYRKSREHKKRGEEKRVRHLLQTKHKLIRLGRLSEESSADDPNQEEA